LEKWQKAINLVAAASLTDLWRRHFLDSAQLLDLAPAPNHAGPRRWLDLGSGAGFPGMVVAIMGAGEVHLVESDARKCVFLQEVARETAAPVTIHRSRIEDLETFPVDVVSARALAPLDRLLALSARFFAQDTVGLFLKGQHVDKELTEAGKSWMMSADRIVSRSDPSGTVVRIQGLSPGLSHV
jgi:16S rRNA (guanine527-N7)-methyltransferase